jgi:hypothetical protein
MKTISNKKNPPNCKIYIINNIRTNKIIQVEASNNFLIIQSHQTQKFFFKNPLTGGCNNYKINLVKNMQIEVSPICK